MRLCIYCASKLIRATGHPTWWLCPKCEPTLVNGPPAPHVPDMRGAPSRPGKD